MKRAGEVLCPMGKEMEMATQEKADLLLEVLKGSAVTRYGEDRAKAIEPTLQSLAKALAAIENYPVKLEEEPSFGR